MDLKWKQIHEALDGAKQEEAPLHLEDAVPLDETHIFCDDRKILNFSSPDYLGLGFHPSLQKQTIKFTLQHTHCSTHSSLSLQQEIEEKLAEAVGVDKAALISSRFQAHTALLPTIATSQSLVFLDRSAHFSLKHAAALSRATVEPYTHNDLSHLKVLLEETKNLSYFSKIIVTESIFSTEGDRAPLDELAELAHIYGALLYVDDSHAFGTLGKKGMGLAANRKEIDIRVASFDHGCGACLAYVGGNTLGIDYLRTCCPLFKENPLPLPALGAIDAALDLIPDLEGERKVLQQRSYFANTQLQEMGFNTGSSTTHIIPLILKTNASVLETYDRLLSHNILTRPLIIPNVPKHNARLLLTINLHHSPDHLNYLFKHMYADKKIAQESLALS